MTWIRQCLLCGVAAVAVLLALGATASAQTLFWDQMNSNSLASWGENSTADTSVAFGYDYSADGIPEAPNSQGGDDATTGLKLEANIVQPGDSNQISLYPIGQNFTGQYRLSFDAWMNYDLEELLLGDAVGTTEFIGGGVGYNEVATDIGSGTQVIGTGDGGSGSDYRAFKSNNVDATHFLSHAEMTAGSRNANGVPHYEDFLPGQAPPAAQGQPAALVGRDGTLGFQWVTWEFSAQNVAGDNIVRVDLVKPNGDRRRWVTIDGNGTHGPDIPDVGASADFGSATEGNIMLFYADFFSSVSPRAALTFGVIDNVHVSVIPEPSSALLCAVALAGVLFGRRRR